MILIKGVVKDGVVVLEEGIRALPDGTRVMVEYTPVPAEGSGDKGTLSELLLRFAGTAKGLPSDFARNHDHYIHGTPKRPENE